MTKISIIYKPSLGNGENRLQTCKMIKGITNLGLKESKDIMDKIYNNPYSLYFLETNLGREQLNQMVSISCPEEIVVNDLESKRELQLLTLGISEDIEYREMLKYFFPTSDLLIQILNRDQMIEVTKQISKMYY